MSTVISGCLVALFALLSNPVEEVAEERVDLVEVNHFHDETGRHKFDQVIYYRWSDESRRFEIVDYKQLRSQEQVPLRVESRNGYLSVWQDRSDHNLLRSIHAKDMIETFTLHDPEMIQRRWLPKERRVELSKSRDLRGRPTKQR